ncbi:SMP-30/gluconolactonase/LRE family protein [Caulobacter sp. X]|uniref:SMP-30/gluconolactonase/LRE family protein n=1 Tax=Caulobacter sp. X TaxID=2048901 RepID=UPI000C159864|nr:SMP-30/gluconolactonase/LRE family protein [Caulobacter sp. X]PIB95239.1 gluconolactonase [Caulobacter sp. X]
MATEDRWEACVSRRAVLAAGALLASAGAAGRPHAEQTAGPSEAFRVDRFSAALDKILPVDTKIERLGGGFSWSEGPTWDSKRGRLYFSDIPANLVRMWSREAGLGVLRSPGGFGGAPAFVMPGTNGLLYLRPDDKVLMCDQDSRSILLYDLTTGQAAPFVRGPNADPFNSPNDLVRAADGTVYFSDPPTGLIEGKYAPSQKRSVNGVYRRSPDGRVALVDGTLAFPNGVALSPDGEHLYVSTSDSEAPRIVRYSSQSGEWRRDAGVWFDMRVFQADGSPGMPDGLKVTTEGVLFATAPGGVAIIDPEGKALGRIVTGKATGNCCFGEQGSTLFITAHDVLLRVETQVKGL